MAMMLRSRTAFSTRVAPPTRAVRLVVRAQQQPAHEQLKAALSTVAKPAAVAAIANAIMAFPAAAEAGKLFDFNLTLPAMVAEFLLLMVFLEKTWFTPVGKILDARDAEIREKLGSVKGDSGDVERMIAEAESILKAARSEVSKSVQAQKNAKQAELDKVYNQAKENVNKETDAAIASLEKESQAMLKKLDAQVDKIGAEVLRRVVPEGVKL